MKALKIGGFVVLGLLGLFLLLGLMAPRHVYIKRSLEIPASPAEVYAVINDLSLWDAWSPWKERDATIATTLGEVRTGKGASYTWTSEDSGEGRMEIVGAWPNDSIHMALQFSDMSPSATNWYLEAVPAGTKVSWTMAADFPYPFNAMLFFMPFESGLTKDYDRGLVLLKEYLAKKTSPMDAIKYEIKEIDFPATHYLANRKVVTMAEMPGFFGQAMPALAGAMQAAKIDMTGTPSGLYFVWDEAGQKSDMAVAIPAATGTSLKGFSAIDLPACKALSIDYYGPYAGTGAAHLALDEYISANKLTFDAPAIEEYVTDPGSEPDTAKWLTRIVYLLKK